MLSLPLAHIRRQNPNLFAFPFVSDQSKLSQVFDSLALIFLKESEITSMGSKSKNDNPHTAHTGDGASPGFVSLSLLSLPI